MFNTQDNGFLCVGNSWILKYDVHTWSRRGEIAAAFTGRSVVQVFNTVNVRISYTVYDSDLGGWEFCKREQQSTKMSDSEVDGNFDEAEITVEDLMSISDKVVDQIIMLIGDTTSIFEGGGEGNGGRWGSLWKNLLDEMCT